MKRAFTLLEVIIVITLLGLVFGLFSYVFKSSVESSVFLAGDSQRLKEEALLVWNIQRKVISAKDAYMEKDKLFLHTYAGDYYPGLVKCVFIYKDGVLYYYEFPYPYGDIKFYEDDKLIKLGKFKELSFSAVKGGKTEETYKGLPDLYRITIDGREYLIKP
jgi:prepilin-type N-terminal cleavage/methylation domain-containing protein